jgi:conserved oligomeric Golgi complex subunit 2
LRSELRSRSQLLSKELLDLVNSNYQDFLSLGSSLKSGDEKVEEVRVGLLGFRKEVESVRKHVSEREDEVKGLVEERIAIRKDIVARRKLVEYDERLKGLEDALVVESAGKGTGNGIEEVSESEDDEDDEEEGAYSISAVKLRKHVQQYRLIQEIGKGVSEQHPFVIAQAPRMMKVRNTLLLDLSTALQQAKAGGPSGTDRVIKIMNIYADMDESAEAVKVLKSLKAT